MGGATLTEPTKLSQNVWPKADVPRPHKKSRVIVKACAKCRGRGYGSWRPDGGVCWSCGGSGRATKKGWTFPESWTDDECRAWLTERETALAERRAERQREREATKKREATKPYRKNLRRFPVLREAAKVKDPPEFVRDIVAKARKWETTERQAAAVERYLQQQKADDERLKIDVPEGRQVVQGVVMTTKYTSSPWGETLKILVECEGYRIYGTCPRAIQDVQRGATVTFTATLQHKEPGFGFFSRPTNAEVCD